MTCPVTEKSGICVNFLLYTIKEKTMVDKIGNMSVGAFVAIMVTTAVILIASLLMLTRRRKSSYVRFFDEPNKTHIPFTGLVPGPHREYDNTYRTF